jgi:hypothetical protein
VNPDEPDVVFWLSMSAILTGLAAEIIPHARRIMKQDPLVPVGGHGFALACNQRREEAIRLLKEAYGMDAGSLIAHYLVLLG